MKHTRKVRTFPILIGVVLGTASGLVQSELMIYPQTGQTPEQMSKDRGECHEWAVQQSGYNPTDQTTTKERTVARGGARGAAAGAAIGAIAGDAGKGAAIGAATGGMKKGFERRDQKKQAKAGASAYDQALRACLGGRGYTVQ